jgi:hypothetical protein
LWTMELIKVKPDMFGLTLGYLDDNWMRVREEAKRQGSVLSYRRIAPGLELVRSTAARPAGSGVIQRSNSNEDN